MTTLEEKVAKASCVVGDIVIDGNDPYSEPHIIGSETLFPLLNVPYAKKGKTGDLHLISLRMNDGSIELIKVSDMTREKVKESNCIIVESEGLMTLYKLYNWSDSEWEVWEAKEIKILK